MSTEVIIQVVRPTMHEGQRREPGETLRVSPLVAAEFVRNLKAVLCHAGDAPALHQAVVEDVARQLRRTRGHIGSRPDSPWLPLNY